MIKTLRGRVIGKNPPQAIVESSGVGYGVFMALDALERLKINEEVFVYIHHHVAEDKQDLYGFTTPEQRDFFELLLTVSGVGPKSALSILGSNSADVLRSAIAEGKPEIFANASGIGKKTSERIIVDLKSKIGIQPGLASGYGDTYEALSSLGYSANEVKKALASIPQEVKDTQEQLRLALKALAKK